MFAGAFLWSAVQLDGDFRDPLAEQARGLEIALARGLLGGRVGRRDRKQAGLAGGPVEARDQRIGFGLAGASVLLIWLAALAQPAMQVRDIPLPETLFVFGPYLLPWLLLPVSLWFAQRAARQVDVIAAAPSKAAQALG